MTLYVALDYKATQDHLLWSWLVRVHYFILLF